MVKGKIHIANSMPEVIIAMLSKHDWINVFFFLEETFDKDVLI